MSKIIVEQISEFIFMMSCGMATMLMFEAKRFIEVVYRPKSKAKWVLEILFWIMAAFLFSGFLLQGTKGKIEMHIIIAYVLGVALWKKIFYDIINSGDENGQEEKGKNQRIRKK